MALGSNSSEKKSSKEKPPTPLHAERVEQSTGDVISQDAKSVGTRPSTGSARHGDHNEHGTAQERMLRMDESLSDISTQLRCSPSRSYATFLRVSRTEECQKLRGFNPCGVSQTRCYLFCPYWSALSSPCRTARVRRGLVLDRIPRRVQQADWRLAKLISIANPTYRQ